MSEPTYTELRARLEALIEQSELARKEEESAERLHLRDEAKAQRQRERQEAKAAAQVAEQRRRAAQERLEAAAAKQLRAEDKLRQREALAQLASNPAAQIEKRTRVLEVRTLMEQLGLTVADILASLEHSTQEMIEELARMQAPTAEDDVTGGPV